MKKLESVSVKTKTGKDEIFALVNLDGEIFEVSTGLEEFGILDTYYVCDVVDAFLLGIGYETDAIDFMGSMWYAKNS